MENTGQDQVSIIEALNMSISFAETIRDNGGNHSIAASRVVDSCRAALNDMNTVEEELEQVSVDEISVDPTTYNQHPNMADYDE